MFFFHRELHTKSQGQTISQSDSDNKGYDVYILLRVIEPSVSYYFVVFAAVLLTLLPAAGSCTGLLLPAAWFATAAAPGEFSLNRASGHEVSQVICSVPSLGIRPWQAQLSQDEHSFLLSPCQT